ncbi:MipA/OmpV family protein [Pseudoruegeria sp. HB172150]|uniref:MipA/OmpV family protein n=1 Tax=Pseudoruegeria sp. HB172150 TaxID=2721164 RepID=UPI001556B59B|nr:MipA/OmpV family protein [Pseudoruegeria sp. HB172150]
MKQLVWAAAMAVIAGQVAAQGAGPEWHGMAALGLRTAPVFEGSQDYETLVVPFVSLDYGRVSLGRDGLAITAFREGGATLSATIGYGGGRDGADLELPGQADIDDAFRVGFVGSYDTRIGRIHGSLQHYLAGTEGTSATFGLANRVPVTERLNLSADLSLTFSDDKYMEGYFGLDNEAAMDAHQPIYEIGGGFRRAQLGLGATYRLSENLRLGGQVSVAQLGSEVRDSPVVQEDLSVTGMVFLGFAF